MPIATGTAAGSSAVMAVTVVADSVVVDSAVMVVVAVAVESSPSIVARSV